MTNEELAALIQAGARERIPELWEQVRRFAWRQSRRWAGIRRGGMELEDYLQEAFIAMLDAAGSYDPVAGSSFLHWYALRLKDAFTRASGQRTRRDYLDPLQDCASLDAAIGYDGGDVFTLGDALEDPAAALSFDAIAERDRLRELHAILGPAIAELPADQRAAIYGRYWQGVPVDNKAHSAAIRALRHPRVSRQLMPLR